MYLKSRKHYTLAKEYWETVLKDYITLARVPNDYLKKETNKYSTITKVISISVYRKLLKYCDRTGLNIDSVLDTVFGIVLQKFTYEDDVVFGKNNSMMPVRVKTERPGMKFVDLCRKVMNQEEKSFEYDYFMLGNSTFVNDLNDKLINTVFIFNILNDVPINKENLSKIDMYMKVYINHGLKVKLMYKSSFYDKATAKSFMYLFNFILKQVIDNPEIEIKDIKNTKPEHEEMFVNIDEDYKFYFNRNISYLDLFRNQVQRTPANTAVSDFEGSITYAELDEITDRIAGYLSCTGVNQGDTVAVLQMRDRWAIIAAIAVLKAGAVFFPIDRTNPDERLGYLLEDGEAKVILTCRELIPRVKNISNGSAVIVDIGCEDIDRCEKKVKVKINPKDEAYRISTSGTTGRPKCISIRHESFMNMCYYSVDYIAATEKDVCGIYLSFSFDAVVKQIFPYLMIGASVDILPEYARTDEYAVEKYCVEKNITILALPAILGKLFMNNCPCPGLRILQVGGDRFKGYKEREYKVYNEYGPAEFTVLCSNFHVDKYYDLVPVGKPIYNTDAYILDKNNNVCAVGVPGELCLSGIQIANGYINKPDQNKYSFVENPFSNDESTKIMYRTGDLAKWIDIDGTIAILGRMDSQIKINGIRIEIFEIENMINMIPEIKSSVVVKREDENGDKYLDAYFVPYEDYYEPEKVREFLTKYLPPYMIPKHIVRLCVLPVTPIGKVDKKALPPV